MIQKVGPYSLCLPPSEAITVELSQPELGCELIILQLGLPRAVFPFLRLHCLTSGADSGLSRVGRQCEPGSCPVLRKVGEWRSCPWALMLGAPLSPEALRAQTLVSSSLISMVQWSRCVAADSSSCSTWMGMWWGQAGPRVSSEASATLFTQPFCWVATISWRLTGLVSQGGSFWGGETDLGSSRSG